MKIHGLLQKLKSCHVSVRVMLSIGTEIGRDMGHSFVRLILL